MMRTASFSPSGAFHFRHDAQMRIGGRCSTAACLNEAQLLPCPARLGPGLQAGIQHAPCTQRLGCQPPCISPSEHISRLLALIRCAVARVSAKCSFVELKSVGVAQNLGYAFGVHQHPSADI